MTNISELGWTRWQPDPIRINQPETAAPQAPVTDLHEQATNLKAAMERARQQAHNEGYTDGHAEGHEQGLQEGLEQGLEQGRDEGYQAGFASGYDAGRAQAVQEAEQLAALSQQCAAALTSVDADMGQAMVMLAIRIAEQVLHTTLDTQPEILLELINGIARMETAASAATLQLYVHPDDLELVSRHLQTNTDTSLWRILADPDINRGGCMARTALGDIDATLETRWKRVVSALAPEAG